MPPGGGTSSTEMDLGSILLVASTSRACTRESWFFSIDQLILRRVKR
jgi:hypothetical protein